MTRLLTVDEAAKRLGVKRQAIYNMSYERRIDVVKIGRHLRIREETIERLIERNTRKALA